MTRALCYCSYRHQLSFPSHSRPPPAGCSQTPPGAPARPLAGLEAHPGPQSVSKRSPRAEGQAFTCRSHPHGQAAGLALCAWTRNLAWGLLRAGGGADPHGNSLLALGSLEAKTPGNDPVPRTSCSQTLRRPDLCEELHREASELQPRGCPWLPDSLSGHTRHLLSSAQDHRSPPRVRGLC